MGELLRIPGRFVEDIFCFLVIAYSKTLEFSNATLGHLMLVEENKNSCIKLRVFQGPKAYHPTKYLGITVSWQGIKHNKLHLPHQDAIVNRLTCISWIAKS